MLPAIFTEQDCVESLIERGLDMLLVVINEQCRAYLFADFAFGDALFHSSIAGKDYLYMWADVFAYPASRRRLD
jgi:hypothetical protein